jgi:hypothetical protein
MNRTALPDRGATRTVRLPVRWKAGAVAGIVALAAGLYVLKVAGHMPDFQVYWLAGARAAAGEPLYRIEDGHYQFKYLPAFSVLMVPLSALDLPTASAVWFSLSVLLLGALFLVSLRLLPVLRKPAWVLVSLTLVVMAKFYGRELGLGQVNLLFAAVAAGALLALKTGREGWAGALVALSIVLKPYGVLLLPWLVARRRLPSIAAGSAGLMAALLLPVPLYGVRGSLELHRDWWETVVTSTAPNLLSPDNVSWLALYSKWFGIGAWAAALAVATAVCVGAAGLWMWLRRGGVAFPEGVEGGLLLLLIPLVSPQGWDYVLLVATPAVLYLLNYEDLLPRPLRQLTLVALAVTGLSLYDLMGRDLFLRFQMLSGVTLCFFPVIAAIVALRGRGVA